MHNTISTAPMSGFLRLPQVLALIPVRVCLQKYMVGRLSDRHFPQAHQANRTHYGLAR